MKARLKNKLLGGKEAINNELEISNSSLGLKIQSFRKGLSKGKSKHLEQMAFQEILSLQKM